MNCYNFLSENVLLRGISSSFMGVAARREEVLGERQFMWEQLSRFRNLPKPGGFLNYTSTKIAAQVVSQALF